MEEEYTLLATGGYASVYSTANNERVKKVQSLTTPFEDADIIQYSTLVDLVMHESLSTLPGVPTITSHDITGSNVAMYMPFYGKPLNQRVRDMCPSNREAVTIQIMTSLVDVCLQLQHNGLQHTDMKPSNILVTDTNNVTLIDFNIVSTLAVQEDSSICWTESIGTWNYCAPEIISKYTPHDTSITWTLGLLLAYMLHTFPLEKKYGMNKKQIASRRHWTYVYKELQKENSKYLPLPNTHRQKMSPQLQYIFEQCVQWDPTDRITLFELRSMLHMYNTHGSLPRAFYPHTISWCADPTYTPKHIRKQAVHDVYCLCNAFHKLDLFTRIVSWLDRRKLDIIRPNHVIACFCIAWMLQGEYVLNDSKLLKMMKSLYDFDEESLATDIMEFGNALMWRMWEKTADIYFAEQNRRDVLDKMLQVMLDIDKPYTMEQLAMSTTI